jgi:hypothetical protein
MIKRVSITSNGQFVPANEKGHGKEGQIKKASWYERSVSIGKTKLNKGSLIDFLNTQLPEAKKLKKTWFLASPNRKVIAAFDELYPTQPVASGTNSSPGSSTGSSSAASLEQVSSPRGNFQEIASGPDDVEIEPVQIAPTDDRANFELEKKIRERMTSIQTSKGFYTKNTRRGWSELESEPDRFSCLNRSRKKNNEAYKGIGIFNCQIDAHKSAWVLCICPGNPGNGQDLTKEDFQQLVPEAIEALKQFKIVPEFLAQPIWREAPNPQQNQRALEAHQAFQEWQKAQAWANRVMDVEEHRPEEKAKREAKIAKQIEEFQTTEFGKFEIKTVDDAKSRLNLVIGNTKATVAIVESPLGLPQIEFKVSNDTLKLLEDSLKESTGGNIKLSEPWQKKPVETAHTKVTLSFTESGFLLGHFSQSLGFQADLELTEQLLRDLKEDLKPKFRFM